MENREKIIVFRAFCKHNFFSKMRFGILVEFPISPCFVFPKLSKIWIFKLGCWFKWFLLFFSKFKFKFGSKYFMHVWDATTKQTTLLHKVGMLQVYPPYKNLVPRFLGFRKELRVLGSQTILSFPGCLVLRMMWPLDFEELDSLTSGSSFGFVKDSNRNFPISHILRVSWSTPWIGSLKQRLSCETWKTSWTSGNTEGNSSW